MSEDFARIVEALCAIHGSTDRQAAEGFLKHAEANLNGFYAILHGIYVRDNIDLTVRTLAAITFKNGVEKYWRKSAKNALPSDQKESIRRVLLLNTALPPGIARQNSIAIAKISRIDFPNEWPSLFEELLHNITSQTHEALLLPNMWTLHQVIKVMCSQRIARARETFQNVAPSLLEFICPAYENYSNRWLSTITGTTSDLAISDLALKIARRLICYGFIAPHKNNQCHRFFSNLTLQIEPMWRLFSGNATASRGETDSQALVAKHLLHAGKFCKQRRHVDDPAHDLVLEISSSSMENYTTNHNFMLMPGSMNVVRTYWAICTSATKSDNSDIQKVVIQGLLLMKQCLKLVSVPDIHLKLMSIEERDEITSSLQLLNAELFSPPSLVHILECLVTLFLVLRDDDLESWENDPETWLNLQEEAHWQFHIRSCAERVFLDLFAQYKDTLTEPLLRVLQESLSATSGNSLQLKEAMYNAIGIAAPHLYDALDFHSLLGRLDYELRDVTTTPLFQRRILVLLTQCTKVKCSENHLPLVYNLIGSCMSPSNNGAGLALAAAFAAGQIIDCWEWSCKIFEPYAEHYIHALLECLKSCETMESKMRLISSIGIILERMGTTVTTQLRPVIEEIPREWDKCHNEHLLRVALLGLLTRLVNSQGSRALDCYMIAVPLIQYATNAANFEHVYLIEEALELWLGILQNAEYPNQDILKLLPILTQDNMLSGATDTLKTILLLVESYLLLFKDSSVSLSVLQTLLHGMVVMLPQVDANAQSHFIRVLSLGTQILGKTCLDTRDLQTLTELLFDESVEARTNAGISCLLCQNILEDASQLVQVWSSYRQGDITQQVLQRIFDVFDNIGHSKHRKLCAMALTALTENRHQAYRDPNILASLGNVWSDVLAEIQANAGNDLVYWVEDLSQLEDVNAESQEYARRELVSQNDLVSVTRLKPYIRSHLELIDVDQLGVNIQSFLV